ncbi:MAG: glycosyltransferase family 4 protein [Planctomycetaceae bacterium]
MSSARPPFLSPARPRLASSMPAKRRKVLLISGRFQVRGSSMQTVNLARKLPERGFDAEIACTDAGLLPQADRAALNVMEIAYLEVPVLRRIVRKLFARELAKEPPDLIHVQHRAAATLGLWLAQQLHRPYILSVHDYLNARETLPFDSKLGRRVITVSSSVKAELLERTDLPEDRIVVIPSGVDAPPQDELRSPFDEQHTPVVGTAGPLEAARGLGFFLRAIPLVLARHNPVEFLIAGAGPEEHTLRRIADDLGITEFITFVPNVFDLSTSIAAMDVYCLPSLKQGLGTIMLEAMARGRPVIASKVGGVYSVIDDGVSGLLVPPSDSDALASRIVELLSDPAFARRVGAAGREQVLQQFPVDAMVNSTVAVYEQVLEEHAAACPVAAS